MKHIGLVLLLLSGIMVGPARAQFLGPEAWSGAMLGSLIGGFAGTSCHHHGFSGSGAAIGAGIGLVAGGLIGEANRSYYERHYPTPAYVYPAPAPYAYPGYGYAYPPAHAYVQVAAAPTQTAATGSIRSTPPPGPQAPVNKPALVARKLPQSAHQIPDAPRVPDAPTF